MSSPQSQPSVRVASVDAYRGFVMFLMMAEVLHLSRVAKAIPESDFWRSLAWHQTHVEWGGCTLHDLIQPSFSFLVGVALPFSLASRLARGQSRWFLAAHAAWRAVLLVLLGVFLRSTGSPRTNFTFEDTLSQIGLGYFPLFLLGLAPPIWRWPALALLLVGYWGAFAWHPLPGSGFDYPAVGVPTDWPYHFPPDSFMAHWNKNSNFAAWFDAWFLKLFPFSTSVPFNRGGYVTLSFIPTLATMLLGLMAGDWLHREGSPWRKVICLVLAGAVCLGAGLALDYGGVCPIVKRIWTPAWTLYSGGWCFLLLAGFYAVMDAGGLQAWAFPLRVIGMNSIAAYCLAHLIDTFTVKALQRHLGADTFRWWGLPYEPLVLGAAVLLVYWLILLWMYRRGIFLRI